MNTEEIMNEAAEAVDMVRWYYQGFKTIVEFDYKIQGRPAPCKINPISLDFDDYEVTAVCEFSDGAKREISYYIGWIYEEKFNETAKWKEELVDFHATKMYEAADISTTRLNREYEICEGNNVRLEFEAPNDIYARKQFLDYVHYTTSKEIGDMFGLHRVDNDDCIDTHEVK